MRNSFRIMLAAAALGAGILACDESTATPNPAAPTQSIQNLAAPTETALETAVAGPTAQAQLTPTPGMSRKNNPILPVFGYDVAQSFSYLGEPVGGLEGTVVDSYIGYMSVWMYSSDSGGTLRPFSWLVLRDQDQNIGYLVYPAERVFQNGSHVRVEEYRPFNADYMMNNMLVYLTLYPPLDNRYDVYGFSDSADNMMHMLDFPIQSSAPDGKVDGIITFDKVTTLDVEVQR